LCEPGGICISGKVYEEIKNRFQIRYTDAGFQNLKNIAEPVRVYQISVSETPASKTTRSVAKLNWTAGVGLLVILVLGMGWWIDRKSGTAPPANALAPQLQRAENLLWDSIKESHRSTDFNAYLEKFPNGIFPEVARNRLAIMSFGGPWLARMVCPENPDDAYGGAYTAVFKLRVTDGALDGWYGIPKKPSVQYRGGADCVCAPRAVLSDIPFRRGVKAIVC
jgi:hypothetical protein